MTTNTNYLSVNVAAGETVKFFWEGKMNEVSATEAFTAKVIRYNETTAVATIEWTGSPNGKAFVTVG